MRRLAIAYTISSMGTAMAAVAIAYVAYKQTGSVVLTALVYSGNTLPFLFLAPLSSRLVSQFDLRLAMIALDVGKIVILVLAAAIALSGQLSYAMILVVTFSAGGLAALGIAAWPRIAECAAPPGRIADLNALLKSIPAVAGISGAMLGGTVILLLGEGWVFAMDAVSYLPLIGALALMPAIPSLPRRRGAVRSGLRFVRRDERLRDAFILAALLNFAAFPLLSMLPAMAADIDSRGHVLGILTCAFYIGGAAVVIAVTALRRRYTYSQILFGGFFGTGMLLVLHGAVTGWRSPGMDAVTVSLLSLVPLGLAASLNGALLQALVVLSCPDEEKAGVLAVYGTLAAVLVPLGGVLLGVAADIVSPWAAACVAGGALVVLAVALRRRLRVFDALGSGVDGNRVSGSLGGHWHTLARYLAGADFAIFAHHAHFAHPGGERA